MADVQPFKALHYDLGKVGSLDAVAAPPYDVIDAAARARLLERSPYNAVAIDLPKPFDPADPASSPNGDPYAEAARTIDAWRAEGALVDDEEPSIWALTQDYTAPDGSSHSRHAILARVRVEDYESGGIRPHERTHPGPLLDRLELTRASGYNLSPIFSLSSTDAWPLVEPALAAEPWGEATDEGGTVNRVWRVTDPAVHAAVSDRLAGAELLIADGHHRYETARAYRDEVGGEGPHNYTLMALTGLDDPGLTVYPTHRLLSGFAADPERQRRLGSGLRELFEVSEVGVDGLDPVGEEGVGVFGLYDGFHRQGLRLRLKDTAELDRRLEGKPEAYRRLDSAILEALVLKGLAGMTDEDIDARSGLEYAKSIPDALALIENGDFDVAFIQRPVPIEQVRAVAATDENMPPKSTYFFPKVMTGIAFNPVR
ncbi:MAG TPA: DUF1015 domain-containing protein [Solirubrobacterales bacterium]|jgi:uncharacterized protein (DUF1015 family)|nr:DUF1015 domain-containing protein [Solirubrobacterales bacterium]